MYLKVLYAGELIEQGLAEDIFRGDKHHPYTKRLFVSIPNLTVDLPCLNAIDGLIPDPSDLPSDCNLLQGVINIWKFAKQLLQNNT